MNWGGNLAGGAILVNEFGVAGIDGELLRSLDKALVEMREGKLNALTHTKLRS